MDSYLSPILAITQPTVNQSFMTISWEINRETDAFGQHVCALNTLTHTHTEQEKKPDEGYWHLNANSQSTSSFALLDKCK